MLDSANMALIIQIAAGITGAALVYAILMPFLGSSGRTEERITTVTTDRSEKLATMAAETATANRKKQVAESLKEMEERQKKAEKVTLRLRLQRAGLSISPNIFWLISLATGVICAVATFLSFESGPLTMIGILVAGFVGTFGLPRWIVGKMTKKRQDKFLNEMANAMDIITRGIKSGLPLNECLQIIANEAPDPIGPEFKEIVEQQRVGVTLGEALERLTQRVPLAEVRFLAIVISIQQASGGNLSEALGNLSSVLRDRIKMKMKVKALSSEAKASAGVLASLPPGVTALLTMVSPEFTSPLFYTQTGNFFLLFGAFFMTCGTLVMKKMINFKF